MIAKKDLSSWFPLRGGVVSQGDYGVVSHQPLTRPPPLWPTLAPLLKGLTVKFSKVAVVVAGSVMAVGAAAPAFAADGAPMPTSINGGLDQAFAAQPVQQAGDASLGPVVGAVSKTTDKLRSDTSTDSLLGQTTDAAKNLTPALAGAAKATSLLGGLPLGG